LAHLESHTANIRWRAVALPTEHGSWSFVGEPILLGLLLAPGWASCCWSPPDTV
jgi:hypothetical protein